MLDSQSSIESKCSMDGPNHSWTKKCEWNLTQPNPKILDSWSSVDSAVSDSALASSDFINHLASERATFSENKTFKGYHKLCIFRLFLTPISIHSYGFIALVDIGKFWRLNHMPWTCCKHWVFSSLITAYLNAYS